MIIDELERLIRQEGADIFGTSRVSEYVPKRFSGLPYAVTIGVRLLDAVMDEVQSGPTKLYFHHYRTANTFLDMCALKCALYLQHNGYRAVAIPASQTTNSAGIAADFPHKTAANLAGLGFMGKSGLFISADYGPRVRLATVLTDYALPAGQLINSQCGSCRACVEACPSGAIVGNAWSVGCSRDDIVDAALCSRFMKDKFGMIGRGSVCGICAAVCPFGSKTK
jgi:epoxyqueuosine reductase QueG